MNIAAIISGVRQSTATNTYTVGTVRREAELRMEMGESEGGEEMSRRCRTVHCLPPAANKRTDGASQCVGKTPFPISIKRRAILTHRAGIPCRAFGQNIFVKGASGSVSSVR